MPFAFAGLVFVVVIIAILLRCIFSYFYRAIVAETLLRARAERNIEEGEPEHEEPKKRRNRVRKRGEEGGGHNW